MTTKFIKICAYVSFAVLLVVSHTVHAFGATTASDFVQMKEIPNPTKEDGPPIHFAVSKPLPRTKTGKQLVTDEPRLVVYIHDCDGTVKEPYDQSSGLSLALSVVLTNVKPLGLVSVPAGKKWGDKKDFDIISRCIQEALTVVPANEIVLMGQQMGASMALNYVAVAPPEIKEKIIGVVCLRGVGDLAKLYDETKVPKVKLQLRAAMGGVPLDQMQRYKERSCNSHLDELGKEIKVGFIQTTEDFVYPTELQEQLVKSLKRKGIPVKVIQSSGAAPPPPLKWTQAIDFCLVKGLK